MGVLGAIPTLIEAIKSYRYDVPMFTSATAEQQQKLWQKNSDCLIGAKLEPIKTISNVEISTLVCKTGDVLLSGKRPGSAFPQQIWISWHEIARATTDDSASVNSLPSLFSSIHAADVAETARTNAYTVDQQISMTVICQRWLGNGMLLQRISTPQGCFDQVVNTYNGLIVTRQPAPCDRQC